MKMSEWLELHQRMSLYKNDACTARATLGLFNASILLCRTKLIGITN